MEKSRNSCVGWWVVNSAYIVGLLKGNKCSFQFEGAEVGQLGNHQNLASICQTPKTESISQTSFICLIISMCQLLYFTTLRLPFEDPFLAFCTQFSLQVAVKKEGPTAEAGRKHAPGHPLPLPLLSMLLNISPAILETQSMPCWSCYRGENKFQHSNDAGGLITQIYFGKETSARKHSDQITRPLLNKPDKHTAVILNSVGALKKKTGRKLGRKGFDIAKTHRWG